MTIDEVSAAAPETFARQRLTWATYGLAGYFAYLQTVLGPLMPMLREERGLSYTVASLHFSAFALGNVGAGFVGDRALRRWGRWAGLWGGGLGMAAGALLLVISPATLGTVLGTLVMGLFGAVLVFTTQAALTDRHGRYGPVAITESTVAASACAIAATMSVGASAALGFGWRGAILPPLALLPGLWFFLRGEEPGEVPEAPAGLATSSARRLPARFWILWGVLFLGVAVEWSVAYWGADFLVTGPGMDPAAAATALSALFVAMLIGRVAASRLARAVPTLRLLLLSLGVALVGFPIFWLSESTALSLIGLGALGLGLGNVYPLAIAAAVGTAGGSREVAAARLGIAGGGAVLLAPFLLGGIADRVGIEAALGVIAPLLVVAALLAWLSTRARDAASAPGESKVS